MTDHTLPNPNWTTCLGSITNVVLRASLRRLFERAQMLVEANKGTNRVLVVLVSRRMTCLYDMLKAAGFDGFQAAEVVSDRALDATSVQLSGRSILLLDDAFILGSTLVDLYDLLIDRNDPPTVTAMVACVDEKRYGPELLRHIGIALRDPDAPQLCATKDLEEFALDLASSLFKAGVPYFSDFPILRHVEITRESLGALLAGDRWYVADVTPLEQFAGPGRRAYSLIPRDDLALAIRGRLSGKVGRVAEILKIRLYVTEAADSVMMRIVPIGVPGAITARRLDRELEAVEESLGCIEPRLDWREWTKPAKHRLLQMYVSIAVLAEFWYDVARVVGLELDRGMLERSHIELYFGERDAGLMLEAFDAALAAYRHAQPDEMLTLDPPLVPKSGLGERFEVRRELVTNGILADTAGSLGDALTVLGDAVPPAAPAPGETCAIDRFWVHRVLEVFGLIDRDLERDQEMQLRTYDYPRYRRYRERDGDDLVGPRVIKQGITVVEMGRLLITNPPANDEWTRVVCSLAIDVGNDLGVVVPSARCAEPNGPIFRQYRSGETAYLVNGSHVELHGRDTAEAGSRLDWYTTRVIEQDCRGDVEAFLADNTRVLDASLGEGRLVQVWDGTVTSVGNTRFELDVQSRLTADVGAAAIELGVLGPADQEAIAPGSRVEWIVVQHEDELGHGHREATIRVLHPAG